MKRWAVLLMVSAALSYSFSASSSPPKPTADVEHNCSEFALGVQAGAASFSALAATPDLHANRVLALVGFLGVDQFRLFLYPSKDAYEYSDNVNSIYVDVPFDQAVEIASTRSGQYVQLVGRFSTGYDKERYGVRLGTIVPLRPPHVRDVRPKTPESTQITFDVELEGK